MTYEFICCSGSHNIQKPLCVLCSVVLSNEEMKPANLIRYLEINHKTFINKPIHFFFLYKTKS